MKTRLTLVVAGLAALLSPTPRHLIERTYSRGAYFDLQRILTSSSNLVPFALFDVLVAAAAIAALVFVWIGWKSLRARRWRALGHLALTLVAVASAIYLWFLAAWGLNYRRESLREKLDFSPARVTADRLLALGEQTVGELNAIRKANQDLAWSPAFEISRPLAESFDRTQRLAGTARTAAVGRPKSTMFGFYFRAASVDGMTNPFFLETIVNPDLLPFERPFVIAHEWAHLAGYAAESEASYVGWLTCVRGDAAARYSGWLFLYSHIAGGLEPNDRKRLASTLAPEVIADLRAIVQRLQKAQPVVQQVAWRTYDRYLKANRIESGIRNYDEVITLVLGSQFEPGWVPVMRK